MLITEGDVEQSGVRAIEQLLAERVCRSAVYLQTTDSTNSRALADLAATGAPLPAASEHLPRLYLADTQTGGRGRRGQSWISSDQSLTFSLLIGSPAEPERETPTGESIPQAHATTDRAARANAAANPEHVGGCPNQLLPPLVPLGVGVGVARAIEFLFAPLRAGLKWPNDVYLDGGKVAGVLLERHQSSAGRLVAGVGINVGVAPEIASGPGAPVAKSIAQCVGRTVPRYSILPEVVSQVVETICEAAQHPENVLDEFRQRCLLTGHHVCFQAGGAQQTGRCAGVSDAGELMVHTPAGLRYCHSGEVRSVRW